MSDCLFCGIATGEIDANVVTDDDRWMAFRDINPQAPIHILVVPKKHIATVTDLTSADEALVGELVRAAARIATDEGIAEDGYRLVLNTNAGAGQTVFHLHLHLLGGRPLSWPPG
jgi:histidine triad (HIT) family protein